MLTRLAIGQKLGLLLTVPLVALALILIPFSVDRLDEARASQATSDQAGLARDVGRLVQELQQERLLALGYLLLPSAQRTAVVDQVATVRDTAAQTRRLSAGSAEIGAALDRLATLDPLRERVLRRQVNPAAAARAYRDATEAMLDGLRLTAPRGVDARGRTQLDGLDALLRANEDASRVGAAVLTTLGGADPVLVAQELAAQRLNDGRFRQLASGTQNALLDAIEQGDAGRRFAGFLTDPRAARPGDQATVTNALTAASSYVGLRRILEDRIAGEVSIQAAGRAAGARTTAVVVVVLALLLIVSIIALNVAVYRSITRPLRRLTRAASTVAELAGNELARVADEERDEDDPPKLAAVDVRSGDEIGELATAFNRVQATAALLLERQVTTRRNVSLMFANVAQRTRSLVSRQLMHIDDLERDEQDTALLEKLYRLDHLTNRLRRSASSLMVVSGRSERSGTSEPQVLADVIRSALGEIENFQVVRLGAIPDAVVSADLVDNLRLLLAEVLENATAASPPGVPVDVFAEVPGDCRITIVDRGIGMPPDRMEQENTRLLGRERIDIAPTTTLGLFVVGRLARRHGLQVNLTPTAQGGVTATIVIPASRLRRSGWDTPAPAAPLSSMPAALPAAIAATPSARLPELPPGNGDFGWFSRDAAHQDGARHDDTVPDEPAPALMPAPPPLTAPSFTPAAEAPMAQAFSALPGDRPFEPTSGASFGDGTGGSGTGGLRSYGAGPARSYGDGAGAARPSFGDGGGAVRPSFDAADDALFGPSAGSRERPYGDPPVRATWGDPVDTTGPTVSFTGGRDEPSGTTWSPRDDMPAAGGYPPLPPPPSLSREDGPARSDAPRPAGPPADGAPSGRSAAAPRRGGLTRRVPGAHLDESLRDELGGATPAGPPAPGTAPRDPETERAAFAGYAAGLRRAEQSTPTDGGQ